MAYWLDYSAAKLSGAVIRAAGYEGVIRYIDSPDRLSTKHTNLAEYRDHRANDLRVWLVMQTSTSASDGGWNTGVDHGKRALAGAKYLDNYAGPIFFTNDRTTVPSPAAWQAYLDGACSVLGKERVGAYGFGNAMDLAKNHATYFWQAGRRSEVRSHVHVWQDNNYQPTVGGILTDRNLILKPLEDELSWNEQIQMPNGKTFPARDVLAYADHYAGEAVTRLAALEVKVNALQAGIGEAVKGAVAEYLATNPPVVAFDVEAIAKAVNDEAHRRSAA